GRSCTTRVAREPFPDLETVAFADHAGPRVRSGAPGLAYVLHAARYLPTRLDQQLGEEHRVLIGATQDTLEVGSERPGLALDHYRLPAIGEETDGYLAFHPDRLYEAVAAFEGEITLGFPV